jgi:hypothetical protein
MAHTPEPWMANAMLIAAAPDLLAACKALVEVLSKDTPVSDIDEAWDMANRAIDKAEGVT